MVDSNKHPKRTGIIYRNLQSIFLKDIILGNAKKFPDQPRKFFKNLNFRNCMPIVLNCRIKMWNSRFHGSL